jgi:hypothetical protein
VGLTVPPADPTGSAAFDGLGGWPGVLTDLLAGADLSVDQAESVFEEVLHPRPHRRLRRRPAGQG